MEWDISISTPFFSYTLQVLIADNWFTLMYITKRQ